MRGEARKEIETSKLNDCGTLGVQVTGGDIVFILRSPVIEAIRNILLGQPVRDDIWVALA